MTMHQGGRPSKPHMKIRLLVSQSSQAGYNPGSCQSVTQENSQKTRNYQTLISRPALITVLALTGLMCFTVTRSSLEADNIL